MARALLLGCSALLGLAACSAGAEESPRHAPQAPNFVIFLADDLGWGDLGFHGSMAQTPNLNRLAEEGASLNQCYVQPLCTPTRAALLSGYSPMRLGLQYRPIRPWDTLGIPRDVVLLPERLRNHGYATSLIGKWHLGHASPSMHPNRRGFDHFYGFLTGAGDHWTHTRGGAPDWQRNGETVAEAGYSTRLLGQEARRWIAEQSSEQPFFLELAFGAVHTPIQAPDELVAHYLEKVGNEKDATYLAMLESLDLAVGGVLDSLKEHGFEKNTMVLFLSDNGASFAERRSNRPFRSGKGTTFEGGIHVPGVLRWPGHIRAGTQLEHQVAIEDWAPTMLTAAGISLPTSNKADSPLDGRDLLPLFAKDPMDSKRPIFFATLSEFGLFHAVRFGPWKYIRRSFEDGRQRDLLFHLGDDPGEQKNLAKQEPDTVVELSALVDAWKKLYPHTAIPDYVAAAPEGWTPPTDWGERSRP